MAVGYRLSDAAVENLSDIYNYTRQTWDEVQADLYLQSLYAAFKKLVEFPHGQPARNRRSLPFRMVPTGQHFILYDIVDDQIIILTVLHQKQDVEKRIAKLKPKFVALMANLRGP